MLQMQGGLCKDSIPDAGRVRHSQLDAGSTWMYMLPACQHHHHMLQGLPGELVLAVAGAVQQQQYSSSNLTYAGLPSSSLLYVSLLLL
jgi:hypothetical protein